MAATNDKTSSVFVQKDAYSKAAAEVGLTTEVADALWAKLADGSSQRIIGGATAPRQDAANVNNWHWSEIDLLPWAKERLSQLLVGVAAKGVPDKGWCKVTKVEKCEGEASVSNRKGKRIVAFEINLKLEWKGSVEYEDVSGDISVPYISEDVDGDFDVKFTAKEAGDDSHKKALLYLKKQLPAIQEALKKFRDEIHSPDRLPKSPSA